MSILQVEIDGNKIYSHIRKRWLALEPEERVRQSFVCELVNEYGYKPSQMEEERSLTEHSSRGTGQAAADIIVWKSEQDKVEGKTAFMVVECKAANIPLTNKDYYQGANYARWSGADVLVVVNSILEEKEVENRHGKKERIKVREGELHIYQILSDALPFKKRPIANIPHANLINDEEKLQAELTKTTTMSRDEFAKLLLQCHNIIRNNDKLSPEAAFDEISKILFIKIRYEREEAKKANGNRFSLAHFRAAKTSYDSYKAAGDKPFYQVLFEKTKEDFERDNLFEPNETIKIRESSFEEIVEKLQVYDLSNTSDDVKGIAFEQFLGRTFRGELGQFFTPRTLVDFMVEVLDPQEGELVCDPACGSGGFLIKAFEHIRSQIEADIEVQIEKVNEKVFGTTTQDDTDEEKAAHQERLNDPELQAEAERLTAPLRAELKLSPDREKIATRLDKLSKECIYGTDANPRMARVSKMNMIMHGDGHGGVHHNDGLLNVNGIFEERFDVILANPPFGSRVPRDLKIDQMDRYTDSDKIAYYRKRYGEQYDVALARTNENIGKPLVSLFDTGSMSTLTEVLFVERCLNLLKKGGRMGIVLPEGVLNNFNLQKVREYFEGRAKILLITSIPHDVFVASGATVKPSVVFLKRFTGEEEDTYKKARRQALEDIEASHLAEVQDLRTKVSNTRDPKTRSELMVQSKTLRERIEHEVKDRTKELFDYQVPIAEVKKAGISTTGATIENELEPLASEYAAYRKQHRLW